jgi:hypothetical protein
MEKYATRIGKIFQNLAVSLQPAGGKWQRRSTLSYAQHMKRAYYLSEFYVPVEIA